MRPVFFFSIIIFSFLSCAKKATPAATEENKVVTEAKVEEAIKPVPTIVTESSASIAGHAIYDAKCGSCHGLKNVADYTAKQWEPIITRMVPRAKLDSTEKTNVLAYVNFYARPGN
jgi:hypothetical protein